MGVNFHLEEAGGERENLGRREGEEEKAICPDRLNCTLGFFLLLVLWREGKKGVEEEHFFIYMFFQYSRTLILCGKFVTCTVQC